MDRSAEAQNQFLQIDIQSVVAARSQNLTMNEQEVLQEKLNMLESSRRGYLGALTRIYNQIDELLNSYDNVNQIKQIHSKLRLAWHQYESCCAQFLTLIDQRSDLYKRISAQYDEQTSRKQNYDAVVEQFVTDSLVHFNFQVMEDVSRQKATSVGSDISRISTATSKLREAKLAATKASLIERQTENRKKRALQLEMTKMDMEIKLKELEYNQRLQLAQIEMENEVVTARDNAELAELETQVAEQEVSELTKHERVEKDKQSNRTPVISSAYQEHNSAHSAKVNTHPTSQSNQQRETPRLRGNPDANPTTSILHEGIRQTHQFSMDAPGYSEPSRYIPSTRTTQRQSANRAQAVNASRVYRRYWNNDDITISGPVASTPFVQDSVLSSLVTTIEKNWYFS